MEHINITSPNKMRICAIVVTYHPDTGLPSRLQKIFTQVDALVIVDNTPTDALPITVDFKDSCPIPFYLIRNMNNLGIATALNQGLSYANEHSFDFILTLDQDSNCYQDMSETLCAVHHTCSKKPAVIGGNYLDTHNNSHAISPGEAIEFVTRKTVITSGSLVDVKKALKIGGFRDDYFIDQVDHEFCLRLRSHTELIVMSRKPIMAHTVGMKGGPKYPLLGTLPCHPPLRKYYIARNTIVTVRNFWKHEPNWCLRRLTRLLFGIFSTAFFEKQRIRKLRAIIFGIVDGISNRMGPCSRNLSS